jgi:hypothetical protein
METINKIVMNKLTITKADKRKALVILTQEEYKHKINNFIRDNQFIMINNNPTQYCQKNIKQTLKQCNNTILKENMWKYTNMNPAPNLHATIKLLKPNIPIKPIINWKKHLPYTYNDIQC